MKNVKTLAVLLCVMMLVSVIPVMQVSANQSYTAEQLIGAALNTVEYAGAAVNTGATFVQTGNTSAKRAGTAVENNGVFTFANDSVVTSLDPDANGKKFYVGNAKRYGETPTPLVEGKSIFDYVSPNGYSWSSIKAPAKTGDLVAFTISLDNAYSALEVDFTSTDAVKDISIVADGFIINGVANKVAYAFDVATLYDIIIKNEGNGYGIYVKKATEDTYTMVTTYTADYSGSNYFYLGAGWPTGNAVTPTDVYLSGTNYQWVADGTVGEGDLIIDNITAYLSISGVCVNKVAAYESPLTIATILGQNAVKLNDITFDEAMLAETKINAGNVLFAKRSSGTINTTTGAGIFPGKNYYIGFPWGTNGGVSGTSLASGMALELTYTLPEGGTTANQVIFRALPDDLSGRIMVTIQDNGNYSYNTMTYTNTGGAGQKTMLMVYADNKVSFYNKNADGTYAFVGNTSLQSGSYIEEENGNVNIKTNTTNGSGIQINRLTRYGLGVLDSAALPSGAANMVEYVNEGFKNLNEASYVAAVTGENGGAVAADAFTLKVTNPTYAAETAADSAATFAAKDAGIPKGGYAEFSFNMRGRLAFDFNDGESLIKVDLNAKENHSTYQTASGTQTVSNNMLFEPMNWYKMRVLRDAAGNYTAYVKQSDDTNWTTLFAGATPVASATGAEFKITAAAFNDPYQSYASQITHYVDDLKIYGPSGAIMSIMDGKQTTKIAREGATLTYRDKVIVKATNGAKTLIFAGYDGNRLVSAVPVTIPSNTAWSGTAPAEVKASGVDKVKVFLWDDMSSMTSITPVQSFVPNASLGVDPVKETIVITTADIEQGGYGTSDKTGSSTRIRSKNLISVSKGSVIYYNAKNQLITFNMLATTTSTEFLQREVWKGGTGQIVVENDCYLGLIVAKNPNTQNITPAEFDAWIEIDVANPSEPCPSEQRKVYQFGGEGNDWCFVYLPEDYDENRAEAYPFVIANHGNGWEMNGSEATANWTKRTMYVPTTDKNYIDDPAQYNGTSNSALWYSNPTIEALLDAGYIVAGCQNYGDNLYGNDNCRDACVDFFNHMVANYNVEDACYMIGASNGAMTTLNASYLLGEKVKAIILQYPLTCLKNHYFGYEGHQAAIRSAYGITETVTEENFLALIGEEFDPLYANVVDGKKQGYFPATKIYYSETDTLTTAENNALPLYNLLLNSGKTVEKVQVDADGVTRYHGDYAHFNPAEYVEWFNNN